MPSPSKVTPPKSQVVLLRQLDAVRVGHGINLLKALGAAGSGKSAWSKWLNLESSPDFARVVRIAEVFKARLTWVVEDTSAAIPPPAAEGSALTDASRKLVGLINAWPEEHQRAVASLVTDYAKAWGLLGNPHELGEAGGPSRVQRKHR